MRLCCYLQLTLLLLQLIHSGLGHCPSANLRMASKVPEVCHKSAANLPSPHKTIYYTPGSTFTSQFREQHIFSPGAFLLFTLNKVEPLLPPSELRYPLRECSQNTKAFSFKKVVVPTLHLLHFYNPQITPVK